MLSVTDWVLITNIAIRKELVSQENNIRNENENVLSSLAHKSDLVISEFAINKVKKINH